MNEKNDVYAKVVSVVADILKIDTDQIKENSTFESLGADSLDRLEMVMKLEETFGIDIDDEKAAEIQTIQEVVDVISLSKKS